jgi:hypothetical protein
MDNQDLPPTPEELSIPEAVEDVVDSNLTNVDDSTLEVLPTPPVAPKITPEVIRGIPRKVDIEAVREAMPEPAGPAVVGFGERDDVLISALVFKQNNQTKSLSVYHLQRRLGELGYSEGTRDRPGSYGDLTSVAVAKFQRDHGLTISGHMDRITAEAIFDGDPNVQLVD